MQQSGPALHVLGDGHPAAHRDAVAGLAALAAVVVDPGLDAQAPRDVRAPAAGRVVRRGPLPDAGRLRVAGRDRRVLGDVEGAGARLGHVRTLTGLGTMSDVADSTDDPAVLVEHLPPDDPAEGSGVTALLTLRDPRRRNAMSRALSDRLVEALDAVVADETVHAVVVTGAADRGPAFCAGGDLDELAAIGGSEGADGEADIKAVYAGFLALAACPVPTIAAVDGPAVGAGINVALAADIRLAGDTARFEPGFLRLGLHPGGGMTWMTQRLVGPQTTLAMLLAGEGARRRGRRARAGWPCGGCPARCRSRRPTTTARRRAPRWSSRRCGWRGTPRGRRGTSSSPPRPACGPPATSPTTARRSTSRSGPSSRRCTPPAFRAGLERVRRRR